MREQYELWITWRVKDTRITPAIKNAYKSLIKHNYDEEITFRNYLDKQLTEIGNLESLPDENLVNIGFIKWLLYAINRSFSVVIPRHSKILFYSREDKDGEEYKIYNFLLRIHPYSTIDIPSPACEAAKYCNAEYKKSLYLCFEDPIDIDDEFKKLSKTKKHELKVNLEALINSYKKKREGHLD